MYFEVGAASTHPTAQPRVYHYKAVCRGSVWQLEVELSEARVHQYRYCVVLQLDTSTIVRRWETHLLPRQVLGGGGGGDVFGRDGAGRVRVQRGWLAEEVLLTLKLVGPSAVTLYRCC